MRSFFQKQLELLHALTGSRQMEFITKEQAQIILDKLCMYSRQFSRIPIEDQKAEVEKQIIEDPFFKQLDPSTFYRWMMQIIKRYPDPRIIEEKKEEGKPVEIGSPEWDYWLEEFRKAIESAETKFTQKGQGSGSRLRESMDQIAPRKEN